VLRGRIPRREKNSWIDRRPVCVFLKPIYGALAGTDSGADVAVASMFGFWPRGWFDLEKRNYSQLFDDFGFTGFEPQARRIKLGLAANKEKQLEESIPGSIDLIAKHGFFAPLLLPSFTKAQQKFGLAQTTADQAAVACALERFRLVSGQYPEKLDALVPRFLEKVDVISGEPLKYRRTNDGQFVLYSVGWNEKDDGGTIVLTKGKSPVLDSEQGDWVWPYPAK